VRTRFCKALALVGAALIPAGGILTLATWSDYWMHDCYAGGVGGCSGNSLLVVSVEVAPYALVALLGFGLTFAGLKSLTGVTRSIYIFWCIFVGAIVVIGFYSYVLFPWIVPPPRGATTITSTTTVT